MGKVYFIGAGPGDPELITVKGQRIIETADLVLYAGSLVPVQVLKGAKPGAKVLDSSGLTLDETHALLKEAVKGGGMAARVHTGDPALFGAVQEQVRLLQAEGISFEIIPGVSAAFAAAAQAGISFTHPETVQSLVMTRARGRTVVSERQSLASFAAHRCSVAVYLSTALAPAAEQELLEGGFSKDTTVVIAHRVGWPDGQHILTTLENLARTVREHGFTGQAVFLILPGEGREKKDSKLYNAQFSHGFRKGVG